MLQFDLECRIYNFVMATPEPTSTPTTEPAIQPEAPSKGEERKKLILMRV